VTTSLPKHPDGSVVMRGTADGRHAFAPRGLLALEPSAFGWLFDPPVEQAEPADRNGVTVMQIHGPLMHHEDYWCDSYDAIRARVAEAISRGKPVVIEFSSPGGLVSGCFETARDIRAMADAAGVKLTAYVDGQATSAAYALACACDQIIVPEAAHVGSIGVIEALMDQRAGAEMWGTKAAIITSGARKADGHPLAGLSDDAIAAAQARVDTIASIFFDWVAERRGVTADAVKALEAGLVLGKAALGPRLADAVMTKDQMYSALAKGEAVSAGAGANGAQEKTMNLSEAIDALKKMAEGDDEDAAKAKKMLAALDEKDDGDDKAEDPPADDKPKDDKDDDSKASAAINAAARAEASERSVLMMSRPDFSKEQRATLAKAPIEVVRDAVATWPKATAPKVPIDVTPAATRGATQKDAGGSRLPPGEKAQLDAAMGLVKTERTVEQQGNRLVLGVTRPKAQ
jgi:ClpP class serine protease